MINALDAAGPISTAKITFGIVTAADMNGDSGSWNQPVAAFPVQCREGHFKRFRRRKNNG